MGPARSARIPTALAALCLVGGCASSSWLDRHTAGNLWNTAGTELAIFELLERTPPARRASSERDRPSGDDRSSGEPASTLRRRDAAVEILMAVLATR